MAILIKYANTFENFLMGSFSFAGAKDPYKWINMAIELDPAAKTIIVRRRRSFSISLLGLTIIIVGILTASLTHGMALNQSIVIMVVGLIVTTFGMIRRWEG